MGHCNIFVNKFLVTVSVREVARCTDGPVVLCDVMELYGCLQLFDLVFSSIKGSVDIIQILMAYYFLKVLTIQTIPSITSPLLIFNSSTSIPLFKLFQPYLFHHIWIMYTKYIALDQLILLKNYDKECYRKAMCKISTRKENMSVAINKTIDVTGRSVCNKRDN